MKGMLPNYSMKPILPAYNTDKDMIKPGQFP